MDCLLRLCTVMHLDDGILRGKSAADGEKKAVVCNKEQSGRGQVMGDETDK